MAVVAEVADDSSVVALADRTENFDLGFLPQNLTAQCQSLIESYHELHGYACLPNILWKARLGQFIEAHREFRQLVRKASTTRSAKKSNEGFVLIATTILSLEIWPAVLPAGARSIRSGIDGACDFPAKGAEPAHAFDGILSVSSEIYQLGGDRDALSPVKSAAGRCDVSDTETGAIR